LRTRAHEKALNAPIEGAIVEEAVLEDLCEEADLEVENTTLGGNVSNQQKAELLSRLSTNQNTKQYFQVHFFYLIFSNSRK
jgi:hypothetical protein